MSAGSRSVSGMSVLRVVEPVESPSSDAVVARLDDLLDELTAVVADDSPVPDADRIDRLDRLERVRAAIAAVQTAEMVRFAQSQVAQQLAADVHPKRIGQGIADQIALACRVSPWEGSRRLGTARALWFDLPETYSQLTRGSLHERVAEHVVHETRHLDAEQRRTVDAAVNAAGIEKLGGFAPRRNVPESTPTRPTRRATWSAARRSASTGGYRFGPHRTPCRC